MNQTAGPKSRAVVCLFCGLHTPAHENRSVDDPRVSIIRCQRCGKEAPYPSNRIIDVEGMPNSGTRRGRAVGLN
jgi:hypothetical protein